MKTSSLFTALSVFVLTATLTACGGSEDHHEDDSHRHSENESIDSTQNVHENENPTLGPVSIAGRSISITLFGAVTPGTTIHADIKTTGEPIDALRAWIGNESGEGSLKAKAIGNGPTYHIDLEVSANMDDSTAVWFEVQHGEEKSTTSAPLK